MPQSILTEKIGKLGFGYMRLPRKDGAFDMKQICKMADTFIESGGTYFDTAFVYEGAEVALGESVIKRYPRDNVYIATKLNLGRITTPAQVEEQLKTSLERLGTDHIDSYLLHGLSAKVSEKAESLGAWEYLQDLKAKGVIRHMGFSFHSTPEDLDLILTRHPEAEFVQLQLNYLDWDNPKVESRRQYEVARKHGKPVIVMEPVKGGKLASSTSPIAELLRDADPKVSMASWAMRFIAQMEGILVTLSGMSSLEQMQDNVATFSNLKPLTTDEQVIIDRAIGIINAVPRIACTECRYCVGDCPSKIMIPALIGVYNDYLIHNTTTNLAHSYRFCTSNGGKACDCIACRACEETCPQKLEIVDTLAKVSALFD